MQAASPSPGAIERVVRSDRLVVVLSLALITLLAWWYVVRLAQEMNAMAQEAAMHAAMGMRMPDTWSLADLAALVLMWAVMMAGMMLPSAAPMILLTMGVYRRRGGLQARISTASFTSGYLVAWTGFSVLAAASQAGLHAAALMSSAMVSQSAKLAAVLFVVAGIYQWAPFKTACLQHCRSPLAYLTEEWREGVRGAFRMGLRHGLFCVGCCWALMLLLFAAGVMNLLWVAAIAFFVLLEKVLPWGIWIGRLSGAALIGWGIYVALYRA